MLDSQPQCTTGTNASPPTAAGLNATLLAARQLLNYPPPSRASPSATEQWRHDVDLLIVVTINSPHHERQREPSAQQLHFPSSVRVPSVAQAPLVLSSARPPAQHRTLMKCYMMTDLREEINHRRGGEDSCTTIECHHKRRRDTEGCNLEKGFDLHALVGGRQVTHAPLPLTPREFGGCMALAPHLCMLVWPHMFRPHLPEKYDGTVNPAEFL
jgi:hypothetical protein